MATLIISEKRKAAEAIAQALGSVQKIQVNKSVSVFFIKSRDIYVVPLRGHIQQYENIAEFKSWTGKDPREIITNPNAIEKIPIKYSRRMLMVSRILSARRVIFIGCSRFVGKADYPITLSELGIYNQLIIAPSRPPISASVGRAGGAGLVNVMFWRCWFLSFNNRRP